ncbi:MAG: TatD family hydrolase [Acidobacteria bacterium]|nr:TatD family hydrolase [Acidobacteriota bacterium]
MDQFLLDSHAHLDDSAFDADRPAVIERAWAAGLRYILAIGGGTTPETLGAALSIARQNERVHATVGVHPHEARHFSNAHEVELRILARDRKVLALGEIGLDYHYEHSPREIQRGTLIRQFELARELKLPVVIHCRDAWADLRELVEEHWKSAGVGGILHCFSGSHDDAFQFLDWGFLISFAGNVTFKKADDLRAVAREIPLDRILVETDCPYLAPVPYRGKRNEPSYVRETTRALAGLRNIREDELGQQAVRNFSSFFHLD